VAAAENRKYVIKIVFNFHGCFDTGDECQDVQLAFTLFLLLARLPCINCLCQSKVRDQENGHGCSLDENAHRINIFPRKTDSILYKVMRTLDLHR